jgi:hypothetical protein
MAQPSLSMVRFCASALLSSGHHTSIIRRWAKIKCLAVVPALYPGVVMSLTDGLK